MTNKIKGTREVFSKYIKIYKNMLKGHALKGYFSMKIVYSYLSMLNANNMQLCGTKVHYADNLKNTSINHEIGGRDESTIAANVATIWLNA